MKTEAIEKKLRALDIIKTKGVDCKWFKIYACFDSSPDEYNHDICVLEKDGYLTQEEFELLKEVLIYEEKA